MYDCIHVSQTVVCIFKLMITETTLSYVYRAEVENENLGMFRQINGRA